MLWEHIKRCMAKYPYRTISERGAAITYEEAVIFAESFAKKLNAPCYAVICQSEMAAALAIFSCFAANVTAVPLSFKTGEMKCENFFDMIKPPFVITDVGGELQAVDIDRGEYQHPKSNPAAVICAAGFGRGAKGVMLSRANVLSALCDTASCFDPGAGTKSLITKPLCRCEALTGEFFSSVVNGLDIVFQAGSSEPAAVAELCAEQKISVIYGTQDLLRDLSRRLRLKDSSNFQAVIISGQLDDRYAPDIRAAFPNAQIYRAWALPETSGYSFCLPPRFFDTYCGYEGFPLPSIQAKISGGRGNAFPPESEGLLALRGGSVMMGYWGDEAAARKTFAGEWLRTNLTASISKHGFIKIKTNGAFGYERIDLE